MNRDEQKVRLVASENMAVMAILAEFLHRFAEADPQCAAMVRAAFESAADHLEIEAMRPTKALPRYDYAHAMRVVEQLRQLSLGELQPQRRLMS